MPAHLDITRVDRKGATVLVASGEIDLASVEDLERELDGARGTEHIVVDLARVTFVDSTGLRVLIMADERIRDAGGRLSLVVVPGPVTKLFDLTGVDGYFHVVDSQQAALATQ